MIEATCGACGTIARIAEADVPAGAKFITCSSCKSRVALPQGKAAGKPPMPPVKPPAIPGKPAVPPIPSASSKPTVDLADLPAPKRSSALAGAEGGKPAPKSALAGAELPAPKGSKPAASGGSIDRSIDLDDLMPSGKAASPGLADLPAPKARTSALGDAPASKPVASALADLPAPKAKPSPLADLPAPKAKSALSDLPAPAAKKPAPSDLPAPAAKKTALPPKKPADVSFDLELGPANSGAGSFDLDLPAPKAGGSDFDLDLPAPKASGSSDFDLDLPAPKASAKGSLDFDDLPAPKGGSSMELDLGGELDLPAPKAGFDDLPAPKPGSATDLPTPKPGGPSDMLAPKGFFDDLPQPAKKGPAAGSDMDLPAPKGFFDDLPTPAGAKSAAPAAKSGGFFDDLPTPVKGGAAAKPADAGAAKGGFFDDLPEPAKPAAGGAKPGNAGLFDDLEQPAGKPAGGPDELQLGAGDIDLGPLANDKPFELDGSGPGLDLGLAAGDQQFSELDLSEPTTGKKPASAPDEPASPIKIKTPAKGAAKTPIPITVKKEEKASLELTLADDPHAGKTGAAAATATKPGAKGEAVKAKGKTPAKTAEQIAAEKAKKAKRTKVVLAGVLGVALLGSGGFYFYKKHAAEVARRDEIAAAVADARRQLAGERPDHWAKASASAQHALELAPNDGVALGLAAEAAIGGALDNGKNFDARVKQGRKLAQDGLGAGKSGPELQRAQALMQIAANQPDRALPILKMLIGAAPKDAWLQLYLGWAQLEKGDTDAALKAFEAAMAAPGTKIPALYGEGQAKLLKADIPGAHEAFAKVLAADKDHLGAQVGLAATHPPQEAAQKEAELLAVLQRDEVQKNLADPRVVVNAYDMAGDLARVSGRLDIARERYRKAITISKLDIPAHVGLATVELKDKKPQVAADLIAKVSTADANNADILLLSAELDVAQGKFPDATSKLEKLAARQPPLPPLLAARMHVIKGQLLEKQGKDDDAVNEYVEGAKLAGELDLGPTMAAVTKLTDLAKKQTDPAKAADYNKRADEMLSALSERAKEDPELSLALGVAYLQAGNAAKAEDSLRRANTLREKDPETKLQLARALNALNRTDEAIAQLKEALEIDPKRIDVALELAHTYQVIGRDADAMNSYDKLLADPAVPIVVRASAGKWFATKGQREKAAAQAEKILSVEPENPAGLYLKGEGLILGKKWDEARQVLTKATDLDQGEAQYLDALGRAFEGSYEASEDKKFIESARYAYERATKLDPKLFHAQIGLGSMLVEAGDYTQAIVPLTAANAVDKANAEAMYWMGRAYYGVRAQGHAQAKACADWLEASLKAQPALPPVLRAEAGHRLGGVYNDLNNAAAAARGFETGIAAAEEVQKQTGKSPDWLVEDYYNLGEEYDLLHNLVLQKKYWQKYVDNNPKDTNRRDTARRELLTTLKRF